MGRKLRHDYAKIREEYVTGDNDVTLLSLAKKHDMNAANLRRRAAGRRGRNNEQVEAPWTDQRTQYRNSVAAQTREKVGEREAEIRARHINLAKGMQTLAGRRLKELMQKTEWVEIEDPVTHEKHRERAPSGHRELDVTEARLWLKDATEMERKASGMETEVRERVESELGRALEKLEAALTPDEYRRVLLVLAATGDGSATQVH